MTTATPEIQVPQPRAEVGKHIELPPRVREIRHAKLHQGRTDIYEQVFNRYCPKIPLSQVSQEERQRCGWTDIPEEVHQNVTWKMSDTEKYARAHHHDELNQDFEAGDAKPIRQSSATQVMVPDPDVLWVGRVTDGLVYYFNLFDKRSRFKEAVHAIVGGPGSDQGTDSSLQMYFERPSEGIRVELGQAMLDTEPGEIYTSPTTDAPSDVYAEDTPLYGQVRADANWDAEIWTDTQFHLHYLKRGDIIEFKARGWPKPKTNNGEPYELKWVLRPPREYSADPNGCLITAPGVEQNTPSLRYR